MELEKVLWEGKDYMGRLGSNRVAPTVGMVIEVPQLSVYGGKKNKGKGRIVFEICKKMKFLGKVNWKQLFTDFLTQELKEHQ